MAQNDQVAWKYAADEIFGLLKKVREAGGDSKAATPSGVLDVLIFSQQQIHIYKHICLSIQ